MLAPSCISIVSVCPSHDEEQLAGSGSSPLLFILAIQSVFPAHVVKCVLTGPNSII